MKIKRSSSVEEIQQDIKDIVGTDVAITITKQEITITKANGTEIDVGHQTSINAKVKEWIL